MISLHSKPKAISRLSSTSFSKRPLSLTTLKHAQTHRYTSLSPLPSKKPTTLSQTTTKPKTFTSLTPIEHYTNSIPPPPTYKTPTPPGFENSPILRLPTLSLPTTSTVLPTAENKFIASKFIDGLRETSIIQFALTPYQQSLYDSCLSLSKAFFARPYSQKKGFVDERSFAGYIGSGEEITDGKADYSEIFTVVKDLPLTDPRVQNNWPCHGPCPWPSLLFAQKMKELMISLGETSEMLLQYIALGLGLKIDFFKNLTKDGWHHMRVLHFKALDGEKDAEGKVQRGIGAHTDYGLLVLVLSEPVNSVFYQMPSGEWKLLEQKAGTMTVMGGDMMQHITKNNILSTPHKIALNTTENFAFAHFHEPHFNGIVEPAPELNRVEAPPLSGLEYLKGEEKIHYGSHFTEKFMNNYGERVTAKRIRKIGSLKILEKLREDAIAESQRGD